MVLNLERRWQKKSSAAFRLDTFILPSIERTCREIQWDPDDDLENTSPREVRGMARILTSSTICYHKVPHASTGLPPVTLLCSWPIKEPLAALMRMWPEDQPAESVISASKFVEKMKLELGWKLAFMHFALFTRRFNPVTPQQPFSSAFMVNATLRRTWAFVSRTMGCQMLPGHS